MSEFTPAEGCIAPPTCTRSGECRGLTPCQVSEPDPEKRLYPQWGTEDYRIFATLFNDITACPRHIMFSDRKALAEHLWSQGWRREVRPEDVTE